MREKWPRANSFVVLCVRVGSDFKTYCRHQCLFRPALPLGAERPASLSTNLTGQMARRMVAEGRLLRKQTRYPLPMLPDSQFKFGMRFPE